MLACNCSQNLQISQHIEYLLLFTQDPLKCQSCILFEHLSPSLSLCQIYWMPQVKLWFLSALCRETDWALCCLATGWNARDQLFMGRDADPWEMFSFSFFLFSFEFNELPKHKSVTTAAHKCPNQDFWMRFITNSNWCWVLWRRSRLQKHRNK